MNHLYVNENFENEIDYIVQGIHNLKREKNHNDFFCVCLPNKTDQTIYAKVC